MGFFYYLAHHSGPVDGDNRKIAQDSGPPWVETVCWARYEQKSPIRNGLLGDSNKNREEHQ